MFHGKPLNTSQQPPQQQPQQWPLTTQEHNNLRVSQTGQKPPIQVKFYLPEDEIRRSTISTDCTLNRITEQIKSYASVADKDLLLAWSDDQNEWIRFDTDSEFSEAMNYARHLFSLGTVFKIQAKEGKTPVVKKQQPPVVVQEQPKPVVVQPPVEQPKPVVVQPPIQQPPMQPIVQPQPPINTQPNPFYPQYPPVQPQQPFKPMQPMVMPFQQQPQPMMAQPSHQPMVMNQFQPQPMIQPSTTHNMPLPRGSTSPYNTPPSKTLTNSVTMQQPHPLNSSFGSPSMNNNNNNNTVSQSPQPTVQPQVNLPAGVNPESLTLLRQLGFPCDDSVLIKALQDTNGDINAATEKMLSQF